MEISKGTNPLYVKDLSPLLETRPANLDALKRRPHIAGLAFNAGPSL